MKRKEKMNQQHYAKLTTIQQKVYDDIVIRCGTWIENN